jgi:hypothetical protein
VSQLRGHLRTNLVAYAALFVALGGTSYAAIALPANSVGSKQLKKSAVTSSKISPATRAALKGAKGAAGAAGQPGPPGQPGSPGAPGSPGPGAGAARLATEARPPGPSGPNPSQDITTVQTFTTPILFEVRCTDKSAPSSTEVGLTIDYPAPDLGVTETSAATVPGTEGSGAATTRVGHLKEGVGKAVVLADPAFADEHHQYSGHVLVGARGAQTSSYDIRWSLYATDDHATTSKPGHCEFDATVTPATVG